MMMLLCLNALSLLLSSSYACGGCKPVPRAADLWSSRGCIELQ